MRKILLITLSVIICHSILKSETYNLTLEESIEIAKTKSYSMQRLLQEIKITEYRLKSATSRHKTHIDLKFALPEYTETVRQFEDSLGISFYPIKQLNYSTNLEIRQPLLTNGEFFIQTGVATYNDYFFSNRLTNLKGLIGFRQPINAFYGYNLIKSELKKAQLAHEQASMQFKREELLLVYNVSQYYYTLLSQQKSVEIALLDLERQTEANEISKKKYQAGLIREVDALQMEVDLAAAQNSYDIALVNQDVAINSFKEMLGINLTDSVHVSSELKYKVILVDSDRAVQIALKNRNEIRDQDIRIALQKMDVKRQKADGMIKANITGYIEKVGTSKQDINQSFSQSIENSYNNLTDRQPNFGIGLTVTVPILDWGENKALVRANESRLKQLELEKEEVLRGIETNVRNLISSLTSNLKRLQLLEKNIVVAEKSFQITAQRFSDGDIDSQSLALERNRLNTAYRSHLDAYINYQLTLAELTRKTFYDFQKEELIK